MSKFTEKLEWFTWGRRGMVFGVAGLAGTYVPYVWADWAAVVLISAATFCLGAAYMEGKLNQCGCEDKCEFTDREIRVKLYEDYTSPERARKIAEIQTENMKRLGAL